MLTWRSQVRGYWLTGDLGYQDDAGRFYHLDRITDAIETNNGTFYSVLAEELLMRTCPEVSDCTIVGLPNDLFQYFEVYVFLRMRADEAIDVNEWTDRVNQVLV